MEATPEMEVSPEETFAPDFLLRRQPALVVFFRNLFDTLLPFWGPDNRTSSEPAAFWGDVFIYEGVSWWPMLESSLWHLVLIAFLWNVGLIWGPGKTLAPRLAFNRSDVIYYEPTFPALGAAHPPVHTETLPNPQSNPKTQGKSAGADAMRVAREAARNGAGGMQAPPNLALGKGSQLAMMAGNPALPPVPMAATGGAHLILPADALAAIAPPPDVTRAGSGAGRGGNMMEVTVVAPPPEVSGIGKGRGGAGAPGLAAVGPAPNVQGVAIRPGKFDIGNSQAVAPSPQLPMHERRGGGTVAGDGFGGGSGTVVVPPAPTVGRAGSLAAGSAGALSVGGTRVVPPPPSVDGVGSGGTGGRVPGTAIAGEPWRAVPPPPSVMGGSSLGRSPGAGGGLAGLGGSSGQAVPPAPSVGGTSGSGGGKGLLASLFGGGSEVVPPAPSVDGTGVGGDGRGAGIGGGELQAVGPAPSVDGVGTGGGLARGGALAGGGLRAVGPAPSAGGVGGGGRRMASLGGGLGGVGVAAPGGRGGGSNSGGKSQGMIKQAAPPSADANLEPEPDNIPGAHELPVRIISLALALPNTSFFSNYEVFIAERRTKSNRTQLIKLVYESLPYQQRLSDYNLKEAKVYKLRVVRDQSCDETLIQMTWPDESSPRQQIASGGEPENAKDKLPCYRTSADDYRKAVAKAK